MNSKKFDKCFFGVLLREIAEFLEQDEYNDYVEEILKRFWIREDLPTLSRGK